MIMKQISKRTFFIFVSILFTQSCNVQAVTIMAANSIRTALSTINVHASSSRVAPGLFRTYSQKIGAAAVNHLIKRPYMAGKTLVMRVVGGLALYGGGQLLIEKEILKPIDPAQVTPPGHKTPSFLIKDPTLINPPEANRRSFFAQKPDPVPTDTAPTPLGPDNLEPAISAGVEPTLEESCNLPNERFNQSTMSIEDIQEINLSTPKTPVIFETGASANDISTQEASSLDGWFDFLKKYSPAEWLSEKKAATSEWVSQKKANASKWVSQKKSNASEWVTEKKTIIIKPIKDHPKIAAGLATWIVAGIIYEKYYKERAKDHLNRKMNVGWDEFAAGRPTQTWTDCQNILRANGYTIAQLTKAQVDDYINRINNGSLSIPEHRLLWWLFLLHPYSVYKKMSR
jgi:hypothetical protein